jgi:DNA-binding MarR family transcriptional regulator
MDQLELALAVLTRRIEQNARRSELHTEMDRAGYLIARTIDEFGAASVNQIAERLGLDASTVTRQLSALEGRGFIARAIDPGDRRARIIEITELGHRVMRGIRSARRQKLGRALDDWPTTDVATFGHLIDRFNQAVTRST